MRTIFLGMDQAADQLRTGNTGDNPFKKKEVRQALYQAIDIEAVSYTHLTLPTILLV